MVMLPDTFVCLAVLRTLHASFYHPFHVIDVRLCTRLSPLSVLQAIEAGWGLGTRLQLVSFPDPN